MRRKLADAGMNRRTALWMPIVLAAILIHPVREAGAEPEWWPGAPKAAVQAAKQTGKWLVLYFQTPSSENCQRMDSETWPVIDKAAAGKEFIWLKLDPNVDAKFTDHYEVYQTPEFVILDGDTKERGRIRGYVDSVSLTNLLAETHKAAPPKSRADEVVTFPDGKTMTKREIEAAMKTNADSLKAKKYFYHENFDQTGEMAKLDVQRYQMWRKGSIRIEPDGLYKSGALFVAADLKSNTAIFSNPAAAIRVDVSRNMQGESIDKVDQVLGRLKVTLQARVAGFNDKSDTPVECMKLVIVPAGQAPDSPSAEFVKQTMMHRQSQWTEKVMQTPTINFKEKKVYLELQVDYVGWGFFVDNIRVELLSPDGSAGGPKEIAGADTGSMKSSGDRDPLAILGNNSASAGRTFLLVDKNQDNRITPDEVAAIPPLLVGVYGLEGGVKSRDKNGDGVLDPSEF